ncbi:hypothetical protein BFJ72_g14454 [Fusarium proliferatum]|uniref:Uncharacterized protein n=1 Tax=Gibberella intermedia TaxID=948311 RepID=A0A420S2R5_GIBIN|nr:hypothetical protein BFJ72_g14454 [Fusarium proliferatum]
MFDPESGPAFTEYLMTREALTAESNADWSRRRPYPSFKPRGTKGPRSLVDIAISVVGDNFGKIRSIAHLESLPKAILWRVWRYLEARSVRQPADGAENIWRSATDADTEVEECLFMLGGTSPNSSWMKEMRKTLACTAFDSTYAILATISPATLNL